MKKSLFAMGMLAMAVASCTNEEVVDIPSSKGISFNNPYVGTSVRAATATETTVEKLKEADAGFYVYGGYQTLTDVFENTHVTFSGGTWGYEPMSYWKDDEVYKFVAYAPAMGVTPTFSWGTSTDANDAVLTFTNVTVDGTAANKKDFVIGKSEVKKPTAEKPITDGVSIQMKHALSMIKVTLTNGFRDGVKLTISEFAINGIKTTGTFTQNATVVDKAGAWSSLGAAEVTSTFTDNGFTLSTNGQTYANEFIVIPQGVVADAITVTFKGTLVDEKDAPIAVPGGEGDNKNMKSFTIKIPKLDSGWVINSRYNYTTTINGNTFGMKEITFADPTIDPWGDYSNTPVTIK